MNNKKNCKNNLEKIDEINWNNDRIKRNCNLFNYLVFYIINSNKICEIMIKDNRFILS